MNTLKLAFVSQILMGILSAAHAPLWAQSKDDDDIVRHLQRFDAAWTESGWTHLNNIRRQPYMRKPGDTGWQARMLAFRSLVLSGENSMPVLQRMLGSDSSDRRILAAQSLSFLRPQALQKTLIEQLRNDENPSVRLYAADALGTLQVDGRLDWSAIQKAERNIDVRKHAGYAAERNGTPVTADVIETLRMWNPQEMNTAKTGEAAPDFRLKSANGETIRLGQYKGKQAVVLVFIYGDT